MKKKNERVKTGIFGGIFNPVHIGHLIICEYVKEEIDLEKIFFVPTAFPPHKDYSHIVDIKHRIAMIEFALANNENFVIYRGEAQKDRVSFTVDTVSGIVKEYKLTSENLFLIIGEDNYYTLDTWKNPDKLLKLCNLVVVRRPVREKVKKRDKYEKDAIFLDTPVIDISSTLIRQRIGEGKSIKYLVPETVEQYIYKKKLYL